MKKGKLLILLVAMLSLAILFAACGEAEETTEAETPAQTEVATENGSESASEENEAPTEEALPKPDVNYEQEYADHEMHSYFDLSDKEEADPVTITSKIDGEVGSYDAEHRLVVIVNKTIDALENELTEVTVFDLEANEAIWKDSVKSPYGLNGTEDTAKLNVTLQYPLIRVEKTTYEKESVGEGTRQIKEISYYLAEKNGELVHTTRDSSYEKHLYDNGLVCALMGDKYVWIDKEMNVIRSVDAIVANYDYNINPYLFDSEYKGYLYSYGNSELMVFNHSGSVSARYAVTEKDTYISCFVLDDGNVLVQQFTDVGAYGSCDFVISGTRYTMKSMIVNAVNGSVADVELDYIVKDIVTEYEQEDDTPELKLANGSDNLAIVYKFANGSVSSYASICVLDNSCNTVYTVKNDTFGVDFSNGIEYIGHEKYVAYVGTNGQYWQAIFNLDGELISAYNEYYTSMTDDYIVSNDTIYSYYMEPIYDFAADGYTFICIAANDIYLQKINYETGNKEVYRYVGNGETELFTKDAEIEMSYYDDKLYVLYDEEKDVYTVYNSADEAILVSYETVQVLECGEDMRLLATAFNGEMIVYVVK